MTETTKQKIVLELDYEIRTDDSHGVTAVFCHKDFYGHIYLRAGNPNLLKVSLDHVRYDKPAVVNTDPVSVIFDGVNKLFDSVQELKDLVKPNT